MWSSLNISSLVSRLASSTSLPLKGRKSGWVVRERCWCEGAGLFFLPHPEEKPPPAIKSGHALTDGIFNISPMGFCRCPAPLLKDADSSERRLAARGVCLAGAQLCARPRAEQDLLPGAQLARQRLSEMSANAKELESKRSPRKEAEDLIAAHSAHPAHACVSEPIATVIIDRSRPVS